MTYKYPVKKMRMTLLDAVTSPASTSFAGDGDDLRRADRDVVVRWKPRNPAESRELLRLAVAARGHLFDSVRNFYDIPDNKNLTLKIVFDPPPADDVDYKWEQRVLYLYSRFLELEKLMWTLSTLGGAYSAMADYDVKFAETAAEISRKQLKIARELGDDAIVARCHLYQALADAQRGHFEQAMHIVRAVFHWATQAKEELVQRCSHGVARKIVAIRRIGTVALPAK